MKLGHLNDFHGGIWGWGMVAAAGWELSLPLFKGCLRIFTPVYLWVLAAWLTFLSRLVVKLWNSAVDYMVVAVAVTMAAGVSSSLGDCGEVTWFYYKRTRVLSLKIIVPRIFHWNDVPADMTYETVRLGHLHGSAVFPLLNALSFSSPQDVEISNHIAVRPL